MCLLTNLEHLDLNKNHLRTLPHNIGGLAALSHLELSENKLVELPSSFCELNDNLHLSVARNPLERPSIEQARQGISAIRRFFGQTKSKKDAGDAAQEALDAIAHEKASELKNDEEKRPDGRAKDVADVESSRHDWAGPAGTIPASEE